MNFNECPFSPPPSSSSSDVCWRPSTDGATIKSISENIVVNPGDEAKLSCAVDGKFCHGSFSFSFFTPYFGLLCFDGFLCGSAIFHRINFCNGFWGVGGSFTNDVSLKD